MPLPHRPLPPWPRYTGQQQAVDFAVLHKLTIELWPDQAKRPVRRPMFLFLFVLFVLFGLLFGLCFFLFFSSV